MTARTIDLLARFKLGDPGAYEILWKRYEKPLKRFIGRHARDNRQLADDLFQETHLAALKTVKQFVYRRELAFFFWLCEIARRLMARQHRREGVRRTEALEGDEDGEVSKELLARLSIEDASPLDAIADRQSLDVLALGLDELAPRRREAIVLRYVDGLQNDAAAKVMKVSAGAFRVVLSRALEDLRAAVTRRG